MTIDDLIGAGFPSENWPEDLPEPGESNISLVDEVGSNKTFRFEANMNGVAYASEVTLDTATVPNAAEGVGFMLNQFAYLWRNDKSQLAVQPDGTCRRINF